MLSQDPLRISISFGELHTIFSVLKVTEKNIEESGLDKIVTDSEIFGESTLKQFLDEKDMKMTAEAHTSFIWFFLEFL